MQPNIFFLPRLRLEYCFWHFSKTTDSALHSVLMNTKLGEWANFNNVIFGIFTNDSVYTQHTQKIISFPNDVLFFLSFIWEKTENHYWQNLEMTVWSTDEQWKRWVTAAEWYRFIKWIYSNNILFKTWRSNYITKTGSFSSYNLQIKPSSENHCFSFW